MVPSLPLLWLAVSMASQDFPIPPAPSAPSALRFESQFTSFGEPYQFSDVSATFTAVNKGTRPVRLTGLHAVTKGGTVVADPPDVVAPGARLQVRVTQPLGNRLGSTSFRFLVDTDDPNGPSMKLAATAFVQSAYDPEQVRFDFGLVDRARGAQLEADVTTREAERLEVVGVEAAPAWLVLEPSVDRSAVAPTLKLRASVKPGAPLGAFSIIALVRTSLPRQPLLEVDLRGAVDGDIVPSAHVFDFQAVETGRPASRSLELRRRAGGPAPKVLRVDGLPPGAVYSAASCASDPSCMSLTVTLAPHETGFVKADLLAHVEGEAEPLPFSLGALAVAPGTAIRPLPSTAADEEAKSPPARLPSFGTAGPPPSPPLPSPVREVRLKWSAKAEERLYGYVVYRAEDRQGPYQRVSRDIVKVQPGDDAPHRYEFVDREVEAGRTYFYYIDVVTVGGRKVTFSGVLSRAIAADAKAP